MTKEKLDRLTLIIKTGIEAEIDPRAIAFSILADLGYPMQLMENK